MKQADWKDDTDDESNDQELEAHYMYMAKVQEHSESIHKTYLTEQDVQNVLIESVGMSYDSEQIDQNDEDADLAKERHVALFLVSGRDFPAYEGCEEHHSHSQNSGNSAMSHLGYSEELIGSHEKEAFQVFDKLPKKEQEESESDVAAADTSVNKEKRKLL
nr:hypothetical protein [Tanacetum cinerariifolium]